MVFGIAANRPELSVVLPMYNEQEHIQKNILAVLSALGKTGLSWELILVDDGSTDSSRAIAENTLKDVPGARLVSYSPNRGRGYALRKGFDAATGKYVITTESDLSWGADIIPKIYERLKMGDADSVLVSPYLNGGGLKHVPMKRVLLSSLGNKILTFGLPGDLTMVTGMTRGYKRWVLDSMILQMDGKEIHLEIVSKLLAIGAKVVEIPGTISWQGFKKRDSRSKTGRKTSSLIFSHLYFSVVESPIYFIGLLGMVFILLGILGLGAIVLFKFIGFSLLRIPYFPHYVFVSIIIGLLIIIFSLVSSQIKDLQRDLARVYAEMVKLTHPDRRTDKE